MLLELIQLGSQLELSGREPFVHRPIHWVIDLDATGKFLDSSPTALRTTNQRGAIKEERGKRFLCPNYFYLEIGKNGAIGAAAGGGKVPATPGFGRVIEIYGQEIEKSTGTTGRTIAVAGDKDISRYTNFLALHREFAEKHPQNKLAIAVLKFLKSEPPLDANNYTRRYSNPDEIADSAENKDGETKRGGGKKDDPTQLNSDFFTFRISGRLLLNDTEFKQWWTERFESQRQQIINYLPDGNDFIFSSNIAKLTTSFPHISGIPNGGGYCPLASFDKEPSQSYGFGATTTPMTLENAEKTSAALNWLLREDSTHLRLGSDLVAVFWAIEKARGKGGIETTPFAQLIEADPLQVKEFLQSPWSRKQVDLETVDFYSAILSSPQSRITVRTWHTSTLAKAEKNFQSYFQAISLPPVGSNEEAGFAISSLANATIQISKETRPAPDTYISFYETALFSKPIPHKLLTAALLRQRVELTKGSDKKNPKAFDNRLAARTAIIKLYFKATKGVDMSSAKHSVDNDPAYLCGRLLAMLDKIHVEAHRDSGGTASSPANRAYGSASTTPALAFPQLCKLVRHHLNKMGGGMARNLEFGVKKEKRTDGINEDFEGLADIVARLLKTPGQQFPRILNLEEQGRFAIGFYYERSLPIAKTSERKELDNSSASDSQPSEQEAKGDSHNEQ